LELVKLKVNKMNVLITGTNSGFGHALTMEFLMNGATVYGISRRFNDQLKNFPDYYHLQQDFSELDELGHQLKKFLDKVKTLDLVILNAGILPEINDLRKTSIEKITSVMNVNVWANKVILDSIFETVPEIYQIVAISSESDLNGARGWNAYTISKAALNTLIKIYAREIPKTHFSALDPGIVNRDLHENISQLPRKSRNRSGKRIKGYRETIKMTNLEYAANCLVEAMGIVLQEESGSFKDVRDVLLFPELVPEALLHSSS
jgi:benzil reductase ((S)-benzoin forming)